MSTCTCGHQKSSHIYEEGACRPGYVCPCQKFHPVNYPTISIYSVHPQTGEREKIDDAESVSDVDGVVDRLLQCGYTIELKLQDITATIEPKETT